MNPSQTQEPEIKQSHQWTHDGEEVLVVKCTNPDGTAYGGFKHPDNVGDVVVDPQWNNHNECGGGIHGWPWGLGLGDGKEPDYAGRWYVYGVKPEDVVGRIENGAKCKFRTGIVRYVGPWAGALSFTLQGRIAYDFQASSGSASNSGYRGSASNSGDSGSASNSGYRGSAESLKPGTAAICTGLYSKARASEFGCIALAWWNEKDRRVEMRCSTVGEGGLKPDTWYRLNDATAVFEECV